MCCYCGSPKVDFILDLKGAVSLCPTRRSSQYALVTRAPAPPVAQWCVFIVSPLSLLYQLLQLDWKKYEDSDPNAAPTKSS